MIRKKILVFILLAVSLASHIFAQSHTAPQEELLRRGIALYSIGRFNDAAAILQLIGPVPEALYWLSLAEISMEQYNKALSTLDELENTDHEGIWSAESPYHRGRCLFYLGRHEEALIMLGQYANTLDNSDARKAATIYWMGESLFALGWLDNAADAFILIVENYPHSAKFEAASYRLNLINQKRIEAELLALLRWSHEESLKSLEEFQQRERQYEQAIEIYRQRIAALEGRSEEELSQSPYSFIPDDTFDPGERDTGAMLDSGIDSGTRQELPTESPWQGRAEDRINRIEALINNIEGLSETLNMMLLREN